MYRSRLSLMRTTSIERRSLGRHLLTEYRLSGRNGVGLAMKEVEALLALIIKIQGLVNVLVTTKEERSKWQ